jgi:putative FmdB family regulatory protein
MPLYEYECEACGQRFEVIQKFSDAPVEACRKCSSGPVRRLVSSPAIQFKGSGWYVTDYAGKGKSSASESSGETKSESAKTEGTSAATKSESRGEASSSAEAKPPAAPASKSGT